MTFIVNMVRDSAEPGGRDRFSCSSIAWELLIELGTTFGWKPKGAVYLPAVGAVRAVLAARHDYRAGDPQDPKQVEADDATEWAAALSAARRSPHLTAMLGARPGLATLGTDASDEQVRSVNAPFTAILDEFIEYAFGGAFVFSRAM